MNYNTETWWVDFFKSEFTEVVLNQQSADTLAFMKKVGKLEQGMMAFDQCCGKGYLSHELDNAGISVVGIDMSKPYIDYASKMLQSDRATFLLADAKTFFRPDFFDICINWNTSFAYNEDDEENERMLIPFSKNLKQCGQFFICTMNPLFIRKHFQKYIVKQVPYQDSTIITIRESRIEADMMKSEWLIVYPDGHRETAYGQTKLYSEGQFADMLKRHNLIVNQTYGDLNMSPYDEDHPSLIIYGHKK